MPRARFSSDVAQSHTPMFIIGTVPFGLAVYSTGGALLHSHSLSGRSVMTSAGSQTRLLGLPRRAVIKPLAAQLRETYVIYLLCQCLLAKLELATLYTLSISLNK